MSNVYSARERHSYMVHDPSPTRGQHMVATPRRSHSPHHGSMHVSSVSPIPLQSVTMRRALHQQGSKRSTSELQSRSSRATQRAQHKHVAGDSHERYAPEDTTPIPQQRHQWLFSSAPQGATASRHFTSPISLEDDIDDGRRRYRARQVNPDEMEPAKPLDYSQQQQHALQQWAAAYAKSVTAFHTAELEQQLRAAREEIAQLTAAVRHQHHEPTNGVAALMRFDVVSMGSCAATVGRTLKSARSTRTEEYLDLQCSVMVAPSVGRIELQFVAPSDEPSESDEDGSAVAQGVKDLFSSGVADSETEGSYVWNLELSEVDEVRWVSSAGAVQLVFLSRERHMPHMQHASHMDTRHVLLSCAKGRSATLDLCNLISAVVADERDRYLQRRRDHHHSTSKEVPLAKRSPPRRPPTTSSKRLQAQQASPHAPVSLHGKSSTSQRLSDPSAHDSLPSPAMPPDASVPDDSRASWSRAAMPTAHFEEESELLAAVDALTRQHEAADVQRNGHYRMPANPPLGSHPDLPPAAAPPTQQTVRETVATTAPVASVVVPQRSKAELELVNQTYEQVFNTPAQLRNPQNLSWDLRLPTDNAPLAPSSSQVSKGTPRVLRPRLTMEDAAYILGVSAPLAESRDPESTSPVFTSPKGILGIPEHLAASPTSPYVFDAPSPPSPAALLTAEQPPPPANKAPPPPPAEKAPPPPPPPANKAPPPPPPPANKAPPPPPPPRGEASPPG